MAGLCTASTTLHYSNCVPRDAFLCSEHSDSTTSPHATVVDSSRTVMTCSRNPSEVCTVPTDQHLVWFGSSAASGEWLILSLIIFFLHLADVICTLLTGCTGCGKNSFFYSSDATTSGTATQFSPNVSSSSGSQVITGRHGYILHGLDCSYCVLLTSADAVSTPQRAVCSPSPPTLQASSLDPLGKCEHKLHGALSLH